MFFIVLYSLYVDDDDGISCTKNCILCSTSNACITD